MRKWEFSDEPIIKEFEIDLEVFREMYGKLVVEDGVNGRINKNGVFTSLEKINEEIDKFIKIEREKLKFNLVIK